MAKLFFRFGPMNSGKSTRLLQDAFNYEERGQRVVVMKPTVDTKDMRVLSRLGVSRDVDIPIGPGDNVIELFKSCEYVSAQKGSSRTVDCVLVDEAQFLSAEQVDGLFSLVLHHDVPVIAYGIRTDFQSRAFPGSLRLLEIAHSLDEMKTICRCGRKAMFNARKVNGEFISDGSQVAIDDGSVEYESMCGHCYSQNVGAFASE